MSCISDIPEGEISPENPDGSHKRQLLYRYITMKTAKIFQAAESLTKANVPPGPNRKTSGNLKIAGCFSIDIDAAA